MVLFLGDTSPLEWEMQHQAMIFSPVENQLVGGGQLLLEKNKLRWYPQQQERLDNIHDKRVAAMKKPLLGITAGPNFRNFPGLSGTFRNLRLQPAPQPCETSRHNLAELSGTFWNLRLQLAPGPAPGTFQNLAEPAPATA